MAETILLDVHAGQVCVMAPPGYRLEDALWQDDSVVARVTVEVDVHHCPTCGRSDVRRYGRGDVGIRDAPCGGVQARLLVARQRIECMSCNRLARELLPGVSEGHRYTDRCATWMASQFPFCSNVAIASVIGLDEKSVRLFAGEVGVATRRGKVRAEASARCASCLRLTSNTPTATVYLDHASVRGDPDLIALCAACNALKGARWIERI
ncbi:MAG: transposase family protein [Sphingomonas sp.]